MRQPNGTFWTPENDARLAELLDEGGLTTSAIAARLGITKNMVIGRIHRTGLPPVPRAIFWAPHRNSQLQELRDADLPVTEIAARLSCSRGAVKRRIARLESLAPPSSCNTTTAARLQALHDKMDAVLRECNL